jgi:hypothetical protein
MISYMDFTTENDPLRRAFIRAVGMSRYAAIPASISALTMGASLLVRAFHQLKRRKACRANYRLHGTQTIALPPRKGGFDLVQRSAVLTSLDDAVNTKLDKPIVAVVN